MKKTYSLGSLVICLLGLALLIFGMSSYPVRAQDEVTPAPTETQTASPTVVPPSLTVEKSYQFTGDLNNNGSIDPGEKITYIIKVENSNPAGNELVLRDQLNWDYFEKMLENSEKCYINGDFIECQLGQVYSAEVLYTVTLREAVDFKGAEILEVNNGVTVFYQGTPWATADARFWVNAPTSTPTQTVTVTLTPTQTLVPTATFTPEPPPPTPSPPGASSLEKTPVSIITVGLLALIGIGVFTYIGGIAKFQGNDAQSTSDITVARVSMFREGIIIIFIVSAVLLMGIAGTLTSDGVISILSAIVGYVFGRASNKI